MGFRFGGIGGPEEFGFVEFVGGGGDGGRGGGVATEEAVGGGRGSAVEGKSGVHLFFFFWVGVKMGKE